MANPEHLNKLGQGLEVWNRWRRENPLTQPDLSKVSLNRTLVWKGEATLSTDSETDNEWAASMGIDLSDAMFHGLSLGKATFDSIDLSEANLQGCNLGGAQLERANLHRSDLSGAKLTGAFIDTCDLRQARLSKADFGNARLIDINLEGADLEGANFKMARLRDLNLTRANLIDSDISNATVTDVNFSKAILNGMKLNGAAIASVVFADNDLSQVKGLKDLNHMGPSTIGIDTIYKSGGNIPEAFLRGCGVPDNFITYAKELVGKAIDYYSAFISYSSKNTDIAERLHADLQSKGVRCWFAPEDLKIGDPFRQRIDEAIRLHDKLLLILSAESVASNWVASEVESALEREDREKRQVLFPLRIDDAIEQSDIAWAASLRRTRHIGDFSRWKDHDAYSKAFERLLRDLKAEPATR